MTSAALRGAAASLRWPRAGHAATAPRGGSHTPSGARRETGRRAPPVSAIGALVSSPSSIQVCPGLAMPAPGAGPGGRCGASALVSQGCGALAALRDGPRSPGPRCARGLASHRSLPSAQSGSPPAPTATSSGTSTTPRWWRTAGRNSTRWHITRYTRRHCGKASPPRSPPSLRGEPPFPLQKRDHQTQAGRLP